MSFFPTFNEGMDSEIVHFSFIFDITANLCIFTRSKYCNAFPIKQYRVSLYLYTMEPTTNCNFTDKDRELLNSIARTLSVIEKDVKTIQNDIKFAHNYHEFIKKPNKI